MHLQESGEMYLETIYILSKKIGSVRSLGLSEPVIGGRFAVPEGSRVYLKKCEIYCTDRR